jgi:hypothetical protein
LCQRRKPGSPRQQIAERVGDKQFSCGEGFGRVQGLKSTLKLLLAVLGIASESPAALRRITHPWENGEVN